MFLKFILPLFALLFGLNSLAQGKYVKMGATSFKDSKNQNILAVTFSNEDHWHTYWKNPGDAGLEIKLKFTDKNDKELLLKELPWPAPKRYIEQGDMWAYGYGGKYAHFFVIPTDFLSNHINIRGEWLVCKDICIPGSQDLIVKLDENKSFKNIGAVSDQKVKDIFQFLPQNVEKSPLNIFLTKGQEENQLALHYIIENADFTLIKQNASILTPYLRPLFDFKHEEVYLDQNTNTVYGRIYIDWDGIFEDPEYPLPKDGMFESPLKAKFLIQYPKNEKPKIIEKTFNAFTLTGDKELSEQFKTFSKLGETKIVEKSVKPQSKSLLYYILFAFLGGVILNLMPCVLPVISLKLFGLIIHSNETKKQILKHNLAYTGGVLASFLMLGAAVVILKASGDQIGWGFQLQSPLFVLTMMIILLVMALNMLGLFEFVTPGGKHLGNAEIKKGMGGDFINGVLATILSTPCSAPFLGTALTFAFTTSYLNIFLIFIAVGIGLSFPFLLTGFFPALIKFLPKPGLWMENLKRLLGLSLILTAIWLYDVFFAILSHESLGLYINTLFALIIFAFYFRKHMSKNRLFNAIFFLLPILLTVKIVGMTHSPSVQANTITVNKPGINWEPWTLDKMKEKSEEITFINFTAKWCLTCKVNKKLVLQTEAFKDLVAKNNIKLMEADWTKRDPVITQFLQEHNLIGVPAYFIKTKDGKIISLGETISLNKIKKHL